MPQKMDVDVAKAGIESAYTGRKGKNGQMFYIVMGKAVSPIQWY